MQYSQLSQEHKVAFYNDLCEDPYSGDPGNIVPATTSLLKASGWSLDEINDTFKQFVDEKSLNDGQPSKCTVDLGLETPPPQQEAAPAPTPPKRSRKKASAPKEPATNGDASAASAGDPATAQSATGEGAPAPAKKRGNPNLVPREPRIKNEQVLYPGLGEPTGIRKQFKNLLGTGCTLAELIGRYEAAGVSTEAKNKDNAASFVRGYVNNGLRPDVDWCRTAPVSEAERLAAQASAASGVGAAPQTPTNVQQV